MLWRRALLAAGLVRSAWAQPQTSQQSSIVASPSIAPSSSSASPTSSSEPTVHTVAVGEGNFKFTPNETFAQPGDIVQFQFYPTNHSVIRAAYGLPCIPYEDTGAGLVGFFSGHFLVDSLINPPSWNLTINDTQPIFYYCSAPDSCIKQGMVGVINPNNSVSLEKQYQGALQAPYMLEPGQAFPAEGPPTPSFSADPNQATSSPTPSSSSASSAAPTSSHSGLSGGAIAGIVIAAIVFLALLGAVLWLLGRNKGFVAGANSSQWGRSSRADRTEKWATNGAYSGVALSDDATPYHGEVRWNQNPQSYYSDPSGHSWHQQQQLQQQQRHQQQYYAAPVMSSKVQTVQEPMELSAEHVPELEAPHVLNK